MMMQNFTMYRRGDLSQTHSPDQVNAPDAAQFEGVIFSDGRVAVRWLTAKASISVWDSFDDLMAIHGHPEYDSEIVWHGWGLPASKHPFPSRPVENQRSDP